MRKHAFSICGKQRCRSDNLLHQGSYRNMKTKFQDFSRIIPGLFPGFKDSISLTFRQFFIVFAGNGDSETGHTSFLLPEYFHYGIEKYLDY